jgi:hypothetical protein
LPACQGRHRQCATENSHEVTPLHPSSLLSR